MTFALKKSILCIISNEKKFTFFKWTVRFLCYQVARAYSLIFVNSCCFIVWKNRIACLSFCPSIIIIEENIRNRIEYSNCRDSNFRFREIETVGVKQSLIFSENFLKQKFQSSIIITAIAEPTAQVISYSSDKFFFFCEMHSEKLPCEKIKLTNTMSHISVFQKYIDDY